MLTKKFFSFKVRCKLRLYESTLLKYNHIINLISLKDKDKILKRHFLDSAQLFKYINNTGDCYILDIGSGAGFPGVVLSILGFKNIVLIEKSYKKSLFLRKLCSDLKVYPKIFSGDVHDLTTFNFDVIVSRAFSNFNKIITCCKKFSSCNLVFLCLKGLSFKDELKFFQDKIFCLSVFQSITYYKSKIVKISGIKYL